MCKERNEIKQSLLRVNYSLEGPGFEPLPIRVAERSKARVCSRLLAGVERSNPAGGMDVCLL